MSLAKIKKGSKVIMKSFTGTPLGVFEVESSDEKKITVIKKSGDKAIFSRKTGKQINVAEGKERYANTIIEDDGSTPSMRPEAGAKAKKPAKAKKAAKPDPEPEEDENEDLDDEEEEEVPEAKPAKKTSKRAPAKAEKAAPKKKKPAPVEEDEDDEDEYEEVD